VLVAGTDETELTMLCDRVLVFRAGRPVTELTGDFTPDHVVESIFSGHIRKRLRGSPASADLTRSALPMVEP
jgi:ribose transport system ATP-binding protein